MPLLSQSHSTLLIVPSGSVPSDVNATGSPVDGAIGRKPKPATGARLAMTTVCETVAVPPLLSVTRWTTVYVPGVANVWVTGEPVFSYVPLLSQSHSTLLIVPSGSVAPDVKVTLWPLVGVAGRKLYAAAGRRLATTMVWLSMLAVPRELRTRSLTV